MFNDYYFKAGDVTHRTEIKAAPPGESIRYADDIRKELLEKAEKAFADRMSFEFDSPELGKIKFVVAERLDYMTMDRMIYFKLNDAEHRVSFNPYLFKSRQEMIEGLFKAVSENIAAKLLIAFTGDNKTRLFGELK